MHVLFAVKGVFPKDLVPMLPYNKVRITRYYMTTHPGWLIIGQDGTILPDGFSC